MNSEFANYLKQKLKELGIETYAEAEKLTGVSADYISKMIRGLRIPDDTIILKLARGIGVDPGKLALIAKKDKAPEDLKPYYEPRPPFFRFKPGERMIWIGDLPFLLEVEKKLLDKAKKRKIHFRFSDESRGDIIAVNCSLVNELTINERERIDLTREEKRLRADPRLTDSEIKAMLSFLREKGLAICKAEALDRGLRRMLKILPPYDPSLEKRILLAETLTPAMKMEGAGGITPSPSVHPIPIISYADAGIGLPYTDQDYPPGASDEYLPRPNDVADPSAYALKVKGDSMSPKLDENDIVIVSPGKEAGNNTIAVVRTVGDEVYLKKVTFSGNRVILYSINTRYPPISLARDEIRFIHPVVWIKPCP
jgi:SOS-response transcriptional repressor LexA/transcriptional regulator with XRE-family HTH domain